MSNGSIRYIHEKNDLTDLGTKVNYDHFTVQIKENNNLNKKIFPCRNLGMTIVLEIIFK